MTFIAITDAAMTAGPGGEGRYLDERGASVRPCVLALGVDDEFLAAFNAGRPALAATPRGERAAEGGGRVVGVAAAPVRGGE